MDRFSNNGAEKNTADALLQKLRSDLEQNASDKEAVMAEAGSAEPVPKKRYRFRTMKRSEYLEKKKIADQLASAADDADITDADLEELLRSYLTVVPDAEKTADAPEPAVSDAADAVSAADPEETLLSDDLFSDLPEASAEHPADTGDRIPDPHEPLTEEDAPFFEEVPLVMEEEPAVIPADDVLSAPAAEETFPADVSPEVPGPAEDATETDAAPAPEQQPEADAAPGFAAGDPVTDDLLSFDDAAQVPSDSHEIPDLDFPAFSFSDADDAVLPDRAPAPEDISGEEEHLAFAEEDSSADGAESDEDLAALLASIPDDMLDLMAPEDGETAGITDLSGDETAEEAVPDDAASEVSVTDGEPAAEASVADGTEAAPDDAADSLGDLLGIDLDADTQAMSDDELLALLSDFRPDGQETQETQDTSEAAEPVQEESARASVPAEDLPAQDAAEAAALPETSAEVSSETSSGEPEERGAESDAEEDLSDADLLAAADSLIPPEEESAPADKPDGEELDQTDLDLMIAFGMEDQLEQAVGKEAAKKYKKAMGDRKDNHYHEMHMGDRPDTVQDKHAEYVSNAQNKEIFSEYKKKYRNLLFRFLGAVFFFLLLFFFENDRLLGIHLPSLFDRESYPLVYTLFDLQLVVLMSAMVFRGIRTGIRAILRGRPVPESVTGFMFLACLVYTVFIAMLCPIHGLQLYNFPIALAVLFELCYEFMNLRREIMSFKIVSSKKLKYAVDPIAQKDGSAERRMFADYISDDPSMFRIKRTAFVEGFFQRSETYPRTQRILRSVLPAVLLLMLTFFAAEFMLTGSLYSAVNVAYITMLLTLPSCAFIAFSYPMFRASGIAYEKESAMIGEASLGEYADASVVSFDDKEVFPAKRIRVGNVKVYGNNRIDHVIYAAASVFHVVGGPLADVFETATGEIGFAENVQLVRLDRDGIEARVDGGAVLIGKASFMNRYGYQVTLNASEKTGEETGDASVLYIAYDNNIAAKLYIQYQVVPDFEVVLKQLYRQGVCVGIKTSDPNIDDHLLSCKIKMSKYPIRIIKCAEPKETAIIVDRLSSGIVSKSSAKSLLQTLAMCDRVLNASRMNNILGMISILLGMAAMIFFVISGMAVTAAPLWVALYQFFWIIPMIITARYYI